MLQKIFITVLEMSLVASLAIPVVLLMRLLLKKLPKIISYGLWAVVLFRLLCPFSVTAVFSLMPDDVSSGEIVERVIDDYVGETAVYDDRTVFPSPQRLKIRGFLFCRPYGLQV